MKKRILSVLTVLMGAMTVLLSCTEDDFNQAQGDTPAGYMNISFKTDMADMQTVQVRAVDPDGIDVQNISLFCFNPYGLFIAAVDAAPNRESATSGTFTANVPEETKIIHFLANQNPALYSDEDFVNKNEAETFSKTDDKANGLTDWSSRFSDCYIEQFFEIINIK